MSLAIALLVGVPLVMTPFSRRAQASKVPPPVPATFLGAAGPAAMQTAMDVCTGANFSPSMASPVAAGSQPGSVAMGDFNHDGIPDLAVTHFNAGQVTILLGDGKGGFTEAPGSPVSTGTGTSPNFIVVGDFNNDGNLDLATANPHPSDSVSVLLGNGSGGFAPATGSPVAVAGSPLSIAIGDFNRDGKLDLVTANVLGNNLTTLLGDGAGGFTVGATIDTGDTPDFVAVGDLNNDGRDDLVYTDHTTNTANVLLATAAGGFTAVTPAPAVGGEPLWVAIGDFNRDGKLDLATANFFSNNVTILQGNGDGTFAAGVDVGVGRGPASVVVGDFNQDGKPDLATVNITDNNVTILEGDGSGGFTQAAGSGLGVGSTPTGIVVGDFNRDGKDDIVTANLGSNNVTVLINNCPFSKCNNTNFALGAGSPIGVGFQPVAMAIGDFNNDGKADLAVANANGGLTNLNPGNLTILLGDGTGGFTNKGTVPCGGSDPSSVAVGDFNRDGKQDLAVCNGNSGNVAILLGNGDGTFNTTAVAPISTGEFPDAIAVGDFNNDGKADLAISNDNDSITILLGDGSGGFSEAAGSPYSLGNLPLSIRVGDFNNDGNQDLVVVNFKAVSTVIVLLGDGKGGFSQAPGSPFATGGASSLSVAIGDFNQDGKQDLAIASPGSGQGTVDILLGDGTGRFSQAPGSPIASPLNVPGSLAIGDFNGDGKQDIAFTDLNLITRDEAVDILLGDGTGRFSLPSTSHFSAGNGPIFVVAGDFNRDGKDDLATVDFNGNQVAVLLNTCVNSPPPTVFASPVSRLAGSPSSNSQVATVSDAVDAANTLTVAVDGSTSATAGGVTVSGISTSAAGSVTADVVAVCGATTTNFTLRVTNSAGRFTDATLTVTVIPDIPASITASPVSQTLCSGGSVSFTAAASGFPAPTVQWQVSSGGPFTNIPGATSTTLTLNSVTFAQNGNKYQAVFTNACATATSSAATLTVNTAPVVTTNPTSQGIAASSVTFTAVASGSPAPTIQWQVGPSGGTTFANIPGATSPTLTFSPTPSQSGNKYRAVFTNGCGTATTSAATLIFYDTCIQDNTSRNVLQLNTTTGEYRFIRCSDGFTITGKGSLSSVSGGLWLTDRQSGWNIRAGFNPGQRTGTALIQFIIAPGVSQTIMINDTNPANTCGCS